MKKIFLAPRRYLWACERLTSTLSVKVAPSCERIKKYLNEAARLMNCLGSEAELGLACLFGLWHFEPAAWFFGGKRFCEGGTIWKRKLIDWLSSLFNSYVSHFDDDAYSWFEIKGFIFSIHTHLLSLRNFCIAIAGGRQSLVVKLLPRAIRTIWEDFQK